MSAKLVLDMAAMQEDFFADRALIGIASAAPAYRLCWQINRYFNFNFLREAELDISIKTGKQGDRYFPLYQYKVPMSGNVHLLYGLKNEKDTLLPEARQLDYLWLVQGNNPDDEAQHYTQLLRDIPDVQLAQVLDPEKLKSINNLLV